MPTIGSVKRKQAYVDRQISSQSTLYVHRPALLILLLSPAAILRTLTDIFPNINIPVTSVAWTYTGLNPEDVEARLTMPYEKALSRLVDNIQHLESLQAQSPRSTTSRSGRLAVPRSICERWPA
jgi:multidrug efflux pump subunit AcrB